ncbi:hypothetical protein WKI65_44030 [Streptomyces sp. MS1.AVA.3]|uniref:hypothetical protein n=1 Tax=Streptomyces decoyicus TaxID=249567 RepID=UPI0030C1539B
MKHHSTHGGDVTKSNTSARNESQLTVEDIDHRLAEIHAERRDDETAHGLEDALHRDVLAAIAAGAPDAPLLAAAALHTEAIDFIRGCL